MSRPISHSTAELTYVQGGRLVFVLAILFVVTSTFYQWFWKKDSTSPNTPNEIARQNAKAIGITPPDPSTQLNDNGVARIERTANNSSAPRPRPVDPDRSGLATKLFAVRADRFISRAERQRKLLSEFALGLEQWQHDFEDLMSNDRGRRLATVPDNVEFYLSAESEKWPDMDQLNEWETSFDRIISDLSEAKKRTDNDAAVLDSFPHVLDSIAAEINLYVADLDRLQSSHNSRLTGVEGIRLSDEDCTLQRAIADTRHKQQERQDKDLDDAIEKVREEEAQKLREEKLETERQLAELIRKREQKERADLVLQERDAIKKAEEEARLEAIKRERRRRMQTQMSDVRKYLAPFISPGHRQVNRGQQWDYTDKAVGMSLSSLRAVKALQNDRNGYEMFLFVAGGPYNDRPSGVFRKTIGGAAMESEIPDIRRAQFLLEEFGDLLVEDGMLSP